MKNRPQTTLCNGSFTLSVQYVRENFNKNLIIYIQINPSTAELRFFEN